MKSVKPSIISDEELLNNYMINGDHSAIGELYDRYSHLVLHVCLKYLHHNDDSRDATLEIFEKLLVLLKNHRIENFKSWLYVVTKNHCLMKKRHESKINLQLYDPLEFEQTYMEFSDFDHHYNMEDFIPEEIDFAIDQLKEEQKRCINLFYFNKKSYKEISKLTGFDLKQVKSHIQNAKRNLKNILIQMRRAQDG